MARFAGIAGMTLLTLGGSRHDLLSAVIEADARTVPAATDPAGPRMSGGGSLTGHDLFALTYGNHEALDP